MTRGVLENERGDSKMIKTNVLLGIIYQQGYSQAKIAKEIGISPKTFYEKMKKGVFLSTEIEALVKLLNIDNPIEIFFAHDVA